MLPSMRRQATTGLRVGQIGGRGQAAITDRPPRPPRYFVQARGGGPEGRKRLIRQLCTSLILHGAIRTTLRRAEGTKRRMVAYMRWGIKGTPESRRMANKNFLGDKERAADILFNEIGPRFRNLPGTRYCNIIKLGPRPHDKALEAVIQIRESEMDYLYHYAAMVAGRQLAIHSQGFDTRVAMEMAKAWRAGSLPDAESSEAPSSGVASILPLLASTSTEEASADSHVPELSRRVREALTVAPAAGNGMDIHPAYVYLPTSTQNRIVMALNHRSAQSAREFDDLMRYHFDRALALSRSPELRLEEIKAAEDLDKRRQMNEKLDAEEKEYGDSIWEDTEPLVEGEEDWEEKESARRKEYMDKIRQGRIPPDVPRTVDQVGAQIMPRGFIKRPPDELARPPSWARPARQIVKGQFATREQKLPNYSAASIPRRTARSHA